MCAGSNPAEGARPWWNGAIDIAQLLLELYGRIPPLALAAVAGVDVGTLAEPPSSGTNPIAWLVWHATRVQDHHIAEILGTEQIWVSDDWAGRFGLVADASNTGYGHDASQVAAVRPERPEALLDYLEVVHNRTCSMLERLTPPELDRVVDRRWDPPVTLGVRLVSIADDSLQHLGQATYVRGLLGI